MRKRRLYRHSIAGHSPYHPGRPVGQQHGQQHGQQQEQPDWEQAIFERGLQHGMRIASMQQHQLVQAHQQALALASQSKARIAQAQRDGFNRGYAEGMQKSTPAPSPADPNKTYTYSDVESARARAFEAGRKSVKGAVQPDESKIRKKLVDRMLQECQDMVARNPNMTAGPFANAMKHRLKKLG